MADYITAATLAAEVGASNERDQLKLDAAVGAASRQVDHHCGRRFYQDSTVVIREFYPQSAICVDLLEQPGTDPKVEISTTSGLIVKIDAAGDGSFGTTLTVNTDFLLLPRNAAADGRPYSELYAVGNYYFPTLCNGRAGVQITARFGWATVPDEVVRATTLQAIYLFKSKDAPLGIAQFGPEGAGMRLANAPLHKAAAGLLAGLQRSPIG